MNPNRAVAVNEERKRQERNATAMYLWLYKQQHRVQRRANRIKAAIEGFTPIHRTSPTTGLKRPIKPKVNRRKKVVV